jgi:hypothetical protein
LASTKVQTRHIISAGRSIYRLTSETIASDPNNVNGAVNYTYDAVGNRKQITSTLAAIPAGLFTFRSISTLPKKPGGVRKRFGSSPYPSAVAESGETEAPGSRGGSGLFAQPRVSRPQ